MKGQAPSQTNFKAPASGECDNDYPWATPQPAQEMLHPGRAVVKPIRPGRRPRPNRRRDGSAPDRTEREAIRVRQDAIEGMRSSLIVTAAIPLLGAMLRSRRPDGTRRLSFRR